MFYFNDLKYFNITNYVMTALMYIERKRSLLLSVSNCENEDFKVERKESELNEQRRLQLKRTKD